VLVEGIGRLLHARGQSRLSVDAFKVPHHGSRFNVSNDLLKSVVSPEYLFSTSGAIFGHPDDEAIGRVLATAARSTRTLHFNYPAATLKANYAKIKKRAAPDWDQPRLKQRFRYQTRYAATDAGGLTLEL
jgi:beta-lactamase superfamily II metal-dependent hydrolase